MNGGSIQLDAALHIEERSGPYTAGRRRPFLDMEESMVWSITSEEEWRTSNEVRG